MVLDKIKNKKAYRFLKNRTIWLFEEARHLFWKGFDRIAYKIIISKKTRILFVAKNMLSLKCFKSYYDLLKEENLYIYITNSPSCRSDEIEKIKKNCGKEFIKFTKSRLMPWKLIIFSDHDTMYKFSTMPKKLRISHGIYGSKLVDGVPYRYDKKWVEYRGKNFYTAILEPSIYSYKFAIKHNPNLKNVVKVVGDIEADNLLKLEVKREDIRDAFGYNKNDFVILVQSTYGENSLMETIGKELINKCVELSKKNKWKFIFQTHPNYWDGPVSKIKPYGKFLLTKKDCKNVIIITPKEHWAKYMVASDIAITDHTSLSMTYALLKKPLLFVNIPGIRLIKNNPGERLYLKMPKINNIEEIEDKIRFANRNFKKDFLDNTIGDILSYSGESSKRIKKEILKILDD